MSVGNKNEEDELFYFESVYLAIKGNKDYSELLKTIAVLEAQRAQAIKDVDKIIELQNEALENPLGFIKKIKDGENLGIPMQQEIIELPDINWSKYNVPISAEILKQIEQEHCAEISVKNILRKPRIPKNSDNSPTFNKPWTSEEQKRLEDLLIKFPPEAIEMRRYKKIANELGNRTVKQVTSRLQKYFLKLHKAGLPVPGRIPKTLDKKRVHKHQRNNFYLYKPTTFFPNMEVPVVMSEDDDLPEISNSSQFQESSTDESMKSNELQLKVELLRKAKMEKELEGTVSAFTHIGYKCNNCFEEPITGTRWHCYDCKEDSFDLCTDCVVAQLLNPITCHPLTHNLVPLRTEEDSSVNIKSEPSTSTQIKSEPNSDNDSNMSDAEFDDNSDDNSDEGSISSSYKNSYDEDYNLESFTSNLGKYNYLDPNFLPE